MLISAIAMLSMHINASAGDLYTGIYNSFKGIGISMDYLPEYDIVNSYTVYADFNQVLSGKYRNAGIKAVYIHYNRLATVETQNAVIDLMLGPGASTGYVRDRSENFGMILTADVGLALRVRFERNFIMELGSVAEFGFKSDRSDGNLHIGMYKNGLIQALLPSLKLMIGF